MNWKIIIFLSIMSLIVSCSGTESNKNLKQVFNNNEIQQLDQIEQIFDRYIRSEYDCESYQCYNEYLKHLMSFEKEGELNIKFPTKYYNQVLGKVNPELIRDIWTDNKKTNSDYLSLNKKGKYYRFLNLLSDSNDKVKEYVDAYNSVDDYTPSLIVGVIPSFVKEDFSNKELRLFIATHFISIGKKSN